MPIDRPMPVSATPPPPAANKLLAALAVLSLFGIVGLGLTALFGFETPNNMLLLVSSVLVLAAPVVMLVHLCTTRELTRQEKRIWIRALTGPRAPWAFSDYVSSDDRAATARRLAEELAKGRRG
jgi:hypothetical protein